MWAGFFGSIFSFVKFSVQLGMEVIEINNKKKNIAAIRNFISDSKKWIWHSIMLENPGFSRNLKIFPLKIENPEIAENV